MRSALLNLSGHNLSEEARTELAHRFDMIEDVPFYEIDFKDDVELQIKQVLTKIKTPLDGSIPISIIPPGQSTLAILLITFLYGLLGYFPGICFLEAESSGKYKPTNNFYIDGHQLRKAGRMFRQEKWKRNDSTES